MLLCKLQAILIATDCNPRGLTKHLPILASSREVPVIFVKDKKGGSFKLGEIVNLKTAMAIGVKVSLLPFSYFRKNNDPFCKYSLFPAYIIFFHSFSACLG